MQIPEFIAQQPADRQGILKSIHEIIVDKDKTVKAVVGTMMGKEMILYNAPGTFKYGLASVKNYMSLHVMPIYMNPVLYDRYKALLPRASFQKGCINFKNEDELPTAIVKQLFEDCAGIDLLAVMESYRQSRASGRK
jgi:hypothetical protein